MPGRRWRSCAARPGPQAAWLADGRRLHLNHGPIDLIVEAFGAAAEVEAAYGQAVARFRTILAELVDELPELRRPAAARPRAFAGPTARRMEAAVAPLAGFAFITPMAAVAGAVADEVLAAMLAGRRLERAYVNNGGDCALHLAPDMSITLAVAGTGHGFADRIAIRAGDPVRGVATSGWRGRSFSLGIADAVTVLARTGAEADAAATLIANAVGLRTGAGHGSGPAPRHHRGRPARRRRGGRGAGWRAFRGESFPASRADPGGGAVPERPGPGLRRPRLSRRRLVRSASAAVLARYFP